MILKVRLAVILPLLTILCLLPGVATPLAHADVSANPAPGSVCISNGRLSSVVRDPTDSSQIGRFTFARGGCPINQSITNPDMILFPIQLNSATSLNTVRVWDTSTDYVEGAGIATDPTFTTVNLDTQSPTIVTTPTQATITWPTSASSLTITQEIETQGSSVSDSRIRVTVSVHNGDTTDHTVSIRDLLDLFIGDYDGAWIRLFSGTTPGSITGLETDFRAPYSFTGFQMGGCSSNPCTPANFGTGTFSLFGSISSPSGSTVPSRFVYGFWPAMYASAFSYTSVQRQIGNTVPSVDGSFDSALLYLFGPVKLASGQTTSATIFLSNQASPILSQPSSQLAVSKFFTRGEAVDNLLPVDSNGNPKVDVVLADGVVRSINPGEIRAWVNVTNNTPDPLQSLKLTETLPVDWLVHPPYLPGRGAIHVIFVDPQDGSRRQLNHSLTVTVSTGNPEVVTLAIPDFNETRVGHPLMPGQSILLSIKLDYGLTGTDQAASSYPRDYTDTATASGFSLPSFGGTETFGTAQGLFVAYAKVVGDPSQ